MSSATQIRIKERDSNIELLRIICMLFILIHHFIIHSLVPDLFVRDGNINAYRVACIIVNGVVYVGVNCFILISGYYGIKFKLRSLFRCADDQKPSLHNLVTVLSFRLVVYQMLCCALLDFTRLKQGSTESGAKGVYFRHRITDGFEHLFWLLLASA